MIYGSFNERKKLIEDESLLAILEEVSRLDLLAVPDGKHDLDNGIFFMKSTLQTNDLADTFVESHRAYIDIHMTLKGCELIGVEDVSKVEVTKEYDEKKDLLLLEGETPKTYKMDVNKFLFCFPEDAHRTAIKCDKRAELVKIIVKIPV